MVQNVEGHWIYKFTELCINVTCHDGKVVMDCALGRQVEEVFSCSHQAMKHISIAVKVCTLINILWDN